MVPTPMQRSQNSYRQNMNQRNNERNPYNQNSAGQGGQNESPWHRSKQCWQCQRFGHIRRFCKLAEGQGPLASQIPLNGQPGGDIGTASRPKSVKSNTNLKRGEAGKIIIIDGKCGEIKTSFFH